MLNWYEAAAKGEWIEINWQLLSDESQLRLLKTLRTSIQRYERQDGYERVFRHDTPEEAKLRLDGEVKSGKLTGPEAERIIQNGVAAASMLANLEARFGQETDWVQQVEKYTQEILGEGYSLARDGAQEQQSYLTGSPLSQPQFPHHDAGMEPAAELTAEAHARRALEHVADYEWLTSLARRETSDDEDAEWLIEMIKDAAAIGYWAGRRIQAATGKMIEYEALERKADSAALLARNQTLRMNVENRKEKNDAAREILVGFIKELRVSRPSYGFSRLHRESLEKLEKVYPNLQDAEGLSKSSVERYFKRMGGL